MLLIPFYTYFAVFYLLNLTDLDCSFLYICEKHTEVLSILIPTYNCQCANLVEELLRQAAGLDVKAEIVVVDDASTDVAIVRENSRIANMPNCRLVRLDSNIGISKMRNRLLQEAKYQWLLCLDADVCPSDADFLKRYVAAIGKAKVVCGGLLYRQDNNLNINPLRYKYGITCEAQTLDERQANPYQSFKTSNYLIDKDLALKVAFDESFVGYGHEDTLFGKMLQQLNEPILHIQNPVYHDDSDTAEEFLAKTRRGIDNLRTHSADLEGYSRLLLTYNKLKRCRVVWLVVLTYKLFRRLIERNLQGANPSMKLFGFYKLGYLCNLK